jgi:nucleotide-binding universal stress UspA family protein
VAARRQAEELLAAVACAPGRPRECEGAHEGRSGQSRKHSSRIRPQSRHAGPGSGPCVLGGAVAHWRRCVPGRRSCRLPAGRRSQQLASPQAVPRQPVVVALDGETAAEPALKAAFEEARLRDTRLVVLHTEPISAPAREVDTARFDIGVVLSRWKQDNADVAISTAIVAGDTDTPLIRWSKSAAALVVGRPHEHRWGSWTRSVARSVMRQTHCPLIVAPYATAEPGAASNAGRSGPDLIDRSSPHTDAPPQVPAAGAAEACMRSPAASLRGPFACLRHRATASTDSHTK